MTFKPIVSLLALSLPLLLVACPDPVVPPVPNGTLALTLDTDDAPSNFEANILVTGPNGFSKTIKTSEGLEVPPGTYTVDARDVRTAGAVVDSIFNAEITAGEDGDICCESKQDLIVTSAQATAAIISYTRLSKTGKLHLPGFFISGNKSVQNVVLDAGVGDVQNEARLCDTALSSNDSDHRGAALDSQGFFWVVCGDNTLRSSDGDGSKGQTIVLPSNVDSRGVAFDKDGNLWVSDTSENKRIIGYAKADLERGTGGSIAPFFTIVVNDAIALHGIAFDASGNMWINDFQARRIFKFDAASLKDPSKTPTPSVVVSGVDQPYGNASIPGSLWGPVSMAFDRDGSLWVANRANRGGISFRAIEKYTPPNQSGAVTPDLMIINQDVIGLAFDNAGSLWMSGGNVLKKFTPDQYASLKGANTLTPAAELSVGLVAFNPVFFPAPKTLPLPQQSK